MVLGTTAPPHDLLLGAGCALKLLLSRASSLFWGMFHSCLLVHVSVQPQKGGKLLEVFCRKVNGATKFS